MSAAPSSSAADAALDEIKRLYYVATKATIERDLAKAIALLKSLPSDDDRERAAVYMDGLAQMRTEWAISRRSSASSRRTSRPGRPPRRPPR